MLDEIRNRYHDNLLQSVIPFWLKHSLDQEHGGQWTCLTREGVVFDTRKYIWMQGRAVWMLCTLYEQLDPKEEWLDAAAGIMDFLRAHAMDAKGHCYFSVTSEGAPVFQQRKPYAAFFYALALIVWSRTKRARGNEMQIAEQIFDRIAAWIADGTLLGRPAYEGQTAIRQLADVYVMAMLAMEMMKSNPQPRYREVLRQCLKDVKEHWLPSKRTLLENLAVDIDYRKFPDTRLLCPGSALEVSWLMWHALEALEESDPSYESFLLDVIEGSLETGWDNEHAGLFYFMDAEGLPCLQLEAKMKLWWPHTEAIYALVLAYSKTRDTKWLTWLQRVDEYAFRAFADPQHGEWFGYCDRYGKPALDTKGGPYKGFFHVPRCLLYSYRRLSELDLSS